MVKTKVKLHEDLVKSGLSDMYQMKHITSNLKLSKFLGKKVRYKKDLLADDKFVRINGSLCKTEVYKVAFVQKDYRGKDVLRGYHTSYEDTFGRCLDPEEIEVAS